MAAAFKHWGLKMICSNIWPSQLQFLYLMPSSSKSGRIRWTLANRKLAIRSEDVWEGSLVIRGKEVDFPWYRAQTQIQFYIWVERSCKVSLVLAWPVLDGGPEIANIK